MATEYQVIGARRVCGYATGERFHADFTESQEKSLIEGGHIARVPEERKPPLSTSAIPLVKPENKPKADESDEGERP